MMNKCIGLSRNIMIIVNNYNNRYQSVNRKWNRWIKNVENINSYYKDKNNRINNKNYS